ncbi:helix-turn-helix transcriptional regulator [Herbaspirillum robiniae]|uniref:Helix-turn-helix domain-containing protein n=1 Tax=Herbaspirillum robiniae TaxID=2014887 RepID=A0A246WM98_9BURK|nr:helix-turn-helix transcriptional regulator [Herbaspirillum robiniae]NUU02990.1 helix-turn-helix domain-containing protein [Herbaspirillum robiniae]OWY27382.1 transcriptional regulator [Herbaspirillum robiniae]
MPRRPTPEERRELGAFLSSRRAALRPADFGLPEGPRRTPGLRREEVALQAGVSVSWYTWLEQGRDIQPSADALRRIARVFGLDQVESDHLFALSLREAPAVVSGGEVSEGLEMLVRAIPLPAYIRNTRLDILAWNDPIAELFVDYGALQPHERNTLRLLFLYQPYRTLILEWEQMARGMISTFRAARAQALDKAPFDAMVEELSALSPEFACWWQDTSVKGFDEGEKRLRHPGGGHIEFHYVALTPTGRPDLSLVTYIPKPAAGDSHS